MDGRVSRAVMLALGAALSTLGCASNAGVSDEVVHVLKELGHSYEERDPNSALAHYCDTFTVEDHFGDMLREDYEIDGVAVEASVGRGGRNAYGAVLAGELAKYQEVHKAKFVLTGLREVDGGFVADAWFNLLATTPSGERVHEESDHRLLMVPGKADGEWLIRDHRVLRRKIVRGSGDQFVERADEVGLGITHRPPTEISEDTPIVPGNFSGSGVSAGDLDGDGFLDLLVGDGRASRLFRNRGDGTFEDVTSRAWEGDIGFVRGAYLLDYDDDGRLDVLFTRSKRPLVLLRNVGGMRFEDASAALAAVDSGESESAAAGDLDGDGDLDVYLVRYGDFEESGYAFPLYNAIDGKPSAVLRNDGEDGFTELDVPEMTPSGWGLAVAMADYDDDGDLDVYVVNDFGDNHLFRNDGGFSFAEVTEEAGVADQGFGMGASFGDYDNDGDLDIYVANMHSSSAWVFEDDSFPLPTIAKVLMLRDFVKEQMRRMLRGNSLMRNEGDGTFERVSDELGVARAGWAWGANFLDYDNDGDLDIYSPNGFITGKDPHDC